ncbi:MAG: hypothetical protein OQK57_07725 [Ignavibacteriaceae bacterium]|nr:hypothetical protein [Ignavibacteriaceae bacterium]
MRKSYFLLIPLLIWGCEKTYDNLIDTSADNYQVTLVSPSDNITFNPSDSLIVVRIIFTTASDVNEVNFDMIASDGSKLNSSPVALFDNGNPENGDLNAGDNRYANKFPMSEFYANGRYNLKFYVIQRNGSSKQVAWSNFNFNNGQTNIAPVISNLVAPDTVTLGTDTTFIFVSVDASDNNGLNDIERVFFNSFLPNGNPSSGNPFIMYDDGTNGDITANDGTYSLVIILPPSGVTLGTYRWEFQAEDRGNKVSIPIIHYAVVI